ncbi:MAG: PfkB family carbohydrate kinase [Gammaproteobacteria bacterium]
MNTSTTRCERILICGTLAFDLIGHSVDALDGSLRNVKLSAIATGFGGCAMNMAYSLRLLGHAPVPLAYVGDDFGPYADHLDRLGIDRSALFPVSGAYCGRGITLTDPSERQFSAFHPGPSGLDRLDRDMRETLAAHAFDAALLAPDLPEKTLTAARLLTRVPLRVWCPGQYAEQTDAATLAAMLPLVDVVVVNRHEWRVLLRAARLLREVPIHNGASGDTRITRRGTLPRIVITRGPQPVRLWVPEIAPRGRLAQVPVPPVPATAAVDPTGCGDAFAAALTARLAASADLQSAVRAGIDLARACLGRPGAQAHGLPSP